MRSTDKLRGMAIKKDKLNLEQKNELEQLRRFIVRQGLVPQMIGSDWRKVIDTVLAIPGYTALYRLRQVKDTQDPAPDNWSGPLPGGLPLYNFIEWLELSTRPDKKNDFRQNIIDTLTLAKIKFSETPTGIRISGYKRNG
jgi:hypothetical protein